MNDEYAQFIVVRTDMDSMTPGRVAAQCAHASSYMGEYFESRDRMPSYDDWKGNRGFGTTYVYETSDEKTFLNLGNLTFEYNKDIIFEHNTNIITDNYLFYYIKDPSYCLIDGSKIHYVEIETVFAAFGPKKIFRQMFSDFGLKLY